VALDLDKIALQVGGMAASLKDGSMERQKHLDFALNVLNNRCTDLASLARKITSAKTTWLVAGLVDGLNRHHAAPPLPPEFTVLATDGSHIDVDRHRSTRCYVINIGAVILHYGTRPGAVLDSFPRLYCADEDLVIAPAASKGREQLIEGPLLGIKRNIDECRQLAELAASLPPDSLALALIDGSLILWGLEAYPEFVTDELLNKGFLSYLDHMAKPDGRQLALASYISFPRSTDVVNVLRVALCPHAPPDCDRYCTTGNRECDAVSGIQDRQLLSSVLGPGERSDTFTSESSIVRKHYGPHQVHFFYLRVNGETARVEIPRWVAADRSLLNLTHALLLDQCRRGHGYPVALSEAHEKAVVTGTDREYFWQLVESSLAREHIPSLGSAKSRSKRTRWV
jgi:hypothetical protein